MTPGTKDFETSREELRKGIGDLEEFANLIDSFPAWWNRMKIDASSQEYRTQAIQINYDSLREKSVIHKWRQLVGQYADYTDQV